MMRHLMLTVVVVTGLAGWGGAEPQAAGLTQPVCESLLYEEDIGDRPIEMDQRRYGVNVSGVLGDFYEDTSGDRMLAMASEYVKFNQIDPSSFAGNYIAFDIIDKRVHIAAYVEGEVIDIIDYRTPDRERPERYIEALSGFIIGNCLVNIGEMQKGYITTLSGFDAIRMVCNVAKDNYIVCSPSFLTIMIKSTFDPALTEGYGGFLEGVYISEDVEPGVETKAFFTLLSGARSGYRHPCYVFSLYLGEANCDEFFTAIRQFVK